MNYKEPGVIQNFLSKEDINETKNSIFMKSRLFVSLLVALFMMSNVFAGTPLEDGLVLKGEFSL